MIWLCLLLVLVFELFCGVFLLVGWLFVDEFFEFEYFEFGVNVIWCEVG